MGAALQRRQKYRSLPESDARQWHVSKPGKTLSIDVCVDDDFGL